MKDKAEIIFEKLALSPGLLGRAADKAKFLANHFLRVSANTINPKIKGITKAKGIAFNNKYHEFTAAAAAKRSQDALNRLL